MFYLLWLLAKLECESRLNLMFRRATAITRANGYLVGVGQVLRLPHDNVTVGSIYGGYIKFFADLR